MSVWEFLKNCQIQIKSDQTNPNKRLQCSKTWGSILKSPKPDFDKLRYNQNNFNVLDGSKSRCGFRKLENE